MSERQKEIAAKLRSYFFFSLATGTFVVYALLCMVLIQSGALPTSTIKADPSVHKTPFELEVAEDGETVFNDWPRTLAAEVRGEIDSTVYPDPETATHAVTGDLPGNPAEAHAVKVCTHSDGVRSNDTGFSYHLTNFRKHENNRHYTTTYHKTLVNGGYLTTDTFHYSVSRSYCGCG